MMKRGFSIVSLSLALAFAAGCEKPSESDCKRAVVNIRHILGTSKMSVDNSQDASWIRSCRGTAKKKSVSCAIDAKDIDGLKACGLLQGAELDQLLKDEADLQKLRNGAMPRLDAGVTIDAAVDPAAGSDGGAATGADAAAASDAGPGAGTGSGAATGPGDGTGGGPGDGTGKGNGTGKGTGAGKGTGKGAGSAAVPTPATPAPATP